ncbi:MAG: hypothetical protein HWE10_12620 [Gammaproteobacteria bacterium]|nr:hypothetical protein [Gammaproteobacteria bacterium]
MFSNALIDQLRQDKNLYYLEQYPIITVYDDNFYVRNDYDVLSRGQRLYLINFFKLYGYQQKSGKLVTDGVNNIHFPKPKHTLALSAYKSDYRQTPGEHFYVVSPSTFAEVLFYEMLDKGSEWGMQQLKQLIDTCPYNIELTRDINYRTPIEDITKQTFKELSDYQENVVAEKFKFKKTL